MFSGIDRHTSSHHENSICPQYCRRPVRNNDQRVIFSKHIQSLKDIFGREIVRQIMSGATQYWDTNFSPARVKETRARFDALLKQCDLEEVTSHRFTNLISREESPIDEGTRWLLVSMTEQLLEGAITTFWDTATIEVLRREWNQWQILDEINFKKWCLNSTSNWDQYLRNATPDLPTMLADYASVIASNSKFEVLWGFINVNLTVKQRRDLLSWYRSTGHSLTGEPLRLGHEV